MRQPQDFLRAGSKVFVKAPVSRMSVAGWRSIAQGKAADAHRAANSNSTRLGAAYDAVLNLSFAVLLIEGWRCTSANGHHAEALEAAAAIVGVTESVFDRVDAIRDLRNNQYQGMEPTADDVEAALEAMARMAPELLFYLARLR